MTTLQRFFMSLFCLVGGAVFVVCALPMSAAAFEVIPLDLPIGQQQTVWEYITNTKGVITVWRVVLGLVDVVIVGALLLAAFANIFRFKIDTYGVKQALPGIIIGIILAHLSFFIMRLFIEGSSVLTQGIAIFVSQYLPEYKIGDMSAGRYLVHVTTNELRNSLFTLPSGGLSQITLAGSAFIGLGITGGWAIAGMGAVLVIAIIIVWLLPMILYLILLFLLYVRSYILVVLFMISPLAFFSLGFPALKSYWQKWWGTTWKWMMMLPIAFTVLSFAPIFLYYVNRGEGTRNLVDYFFFNGVGVAILFFANRVPFMWGSFFGFNAMKEWAKFGSKQGKNVYKGAKWTGDRTGEGWAIGRARFVGIDPGLGNIQNRLGSKNVQTRRRARQDLESLAKKRNLSTVGSDADLINAINRNWRSESRDWGRARSKYAKDIEARKKDARNRNIFRLPEAGYAGVKERLKIWDEQENKNTKRHAGYAWWGGRPVQRSGAWSRLTDEYKDMQDEKIVWGDIKDLVKDYKTEAQSGRHGTKTDADVGKALRQLGQKAETSAWAEFDTLDPVLQELKARNGYTDEDFAKMVRGLNRFQTLVRPQDYQGKNLNGVPIDKKTTKPELIDKFINNPDMLGAGDISEADLATAPESAADLPLTSQERVRQTVLQAAQGGRVLSPDQREELVTHSHEHVGMASGLVAESGAALEAKLREVGGDALPADLAQNIMRTIFNNLYEGILNVRMDTFSGLSPEQFQQILPYVQGYSQSIKGLTNITDILAATDRIGIEGEHAKAVAKLGLEIDTKEAERAIAEAMERLHDEAFSRTDAENVMETYVQYAPHLRFDKSRSLEELRRELVERGRDLRGMLNILNYEDVQRAKQGYNPNDPNSLPVLQKTIQSAVRVEQLKKETLAHAATEMDRALREAIEKQDTRQPIEIVTDQKIIERVRPNVERIMEFHPDMRQKAQSLDATTKTQLADQIARESVARMAQMKDENELTTAMFTRNEPDLRDWLHKALQEGFSRVAVPPTGGV